VIWTAVLGLLVVLSIGLANRRMAGAIVALLGLIIVVPALLEFIEARRFGFGWQGRYTLPLAEPARYTSATTGRSCSGGIPTVPAGAGAAPGSRVPGPARGARSVVVGDATEDVAQAPVDEELPAPA
jgi:hypothetical protein